MCFVVLLGALVPRVTLVLLWLLTDWTRVLNPWWLGLLGFLFLPYTTLAYVAIANYAGAVSTGNIVHLVIMIVAVLVDFGAWGGSHKHYRRRGA
jgi:putative effector of murein hydrolase LrgA (UPF0299 family)